MAPITITQLKDLTYLSLGLHPSYLDQPYINIANIPGFPIVTSGISIPTNTVIALIKLRLRQFQQYQQSWVFVKTLTPSATYTVTIDGTPFTILATGGATVESVLAQLQASIDADPLYDASVTVFSLVGHTYDQQPCLLVSNKTNLAYVISVTSNLEFEQEADNVTARLWSLGKEQTQFDLNSDVSSFNSSKGVNITKTLACSSFERFFIEILTTDGLVIPVVAPCLIQ